MSILGYKIIKLSKTKTTIGSTSEEYEADLTDEKFQEIAKTLGCNLQIVTSGSKWLLHKGDNTDNGWMCQIVSNYFEVRRYLNGQAMAGTTQGTTLQCRISTTMSAALKNLSLRYTKGKDGAAIFKFGNDTSVLLMYLIAEASVVGTDEKIGVYGYINNGNYYLTTSKSETITYTMANNFGYADNMVLMGAVALKGNDAIIEGLYICEICKEQTDHYIFELNGKKYMTSDNGSTAKWAIELDDSMIE